MSTPNPVPPSAPTVEGAPARQVFLQRLFLKDASLEMPNAPRILTVEATPAIDVQVGTGIDMLASGVFQVTLQVTVTAKINDEVAFLAEVHQAGIFQMANFENNAELQHVLAAYCPSVILPFAREAIANLIGRTGYPPVMLQPINFDALYAQHLAQHGQPQGNDIAQPAPTTVQ
ncbi:MAG: protein-export chaperone SecB [Nevskia sp.]|jgi:preprotein translocase subunit SecB|nr:protein-export chaperone SecB [Gammaproteobacteria bacterium]MDH4457138.1 protein-export chaperone SecB [Nevskia sp.]